MLKEKITDNSVGRNDFTGSIKLYYQELSRLKPMDREEEKKLMKLAKSGDTGLVINGRIANLSFVFWT